jgi:hypothetical protein
MTTRVALTAMLALASGLVVGVLWTSLARAKRKRARKIAMRRAAMVFHYPGAAGTGTDDDPYLRVWEKAVSTTERLGAK